MSTIIVIIWQIFGGVERISSNDFVCYLLRIHQKCCGSDGHSFGFGRVARIRASQFLVCGVALSFFVPEVYLSLLKYSINFFYEDVIDIAVLPIFHLLDHEMD